jgi:hypothetical protein
VLLCVITSCQLSDEEAISRQYLTHLQRKEIKKASFYVDSQSVFVLDSLSLLVDSLPPDREFQTVEIKNMLKDGKDKRRMVFCCNFYGSSDTLRLRRYLGKWWVSTTMTQALSMLDTNWVFSDTTFTTPDSTLIQ